MLLQSILKIRNFVNHNFKESKSHVFVLKMKTLHLYSILYLAYSILDVLGQHECNDFTFSDCNIEDNVVWENDQVKLDPATFYFNKPP